MTIVRLYLVKADLTHVHNFDTAVVYAADPADAVAIVVATIDRSEADYANGVVPPVEGLWEPLYRGAALSATEVPVERGPVLGHFTPC